MCPTRPVTREVAGSSPVAPLPRSCRPARVLLAGIRCEMPIETPRLIRARMQRRRGKIRVGSGGDFSRRTRAVDVSPICPQGNRAGQRAAFRRPAGACSSGPQGLAVGYGMATPSLRRRCSIVSGKHGALQALSRRCGELDDGSGAVGRCSAMLAQTTKLGDLQLLSRDPSPLTDSNRRPPPYHLRDAEVHPGSVQT